MSTKYSWAGPHTLLNLASILISFTRLYSLMTVSSTVVIGDDQFRQLSRYNDLY